MIELPNNGIQTAESAFAFLIRGPLVFRSERPDTLMQPIDAKVSAERQSG